MSTVQIPKVQVYLQTNARPLDLALFNCRFLGGTAQSVLDELKKYQNFDGGFGNGIEPDFRLPGSSALGTTAAFQYLAKLGTFQDNELAQRSITYLLQTYNHQKGGWVIVPQSVDNYSHAPWWSYKTAMAGFGWGNPSAEILGYLLQCRVLVKDGSLLQSLTDKALERLHELIVLDKPDFHELLCYIRLYQQADRSLQTQIYDKLAGLIVRAVSTNPDEWKSYGATPLTFVKSPDSPFIDLFDKATIEANLDHLKQSLVNGNHWEPNWDWGGGYLEAWAQAKRAWSGKLTVENMMVLEVFEDSNH